VSLTSRSKAQIAELQVQLAANNKNYFVSKPLSNDLRYDLIIDTGKKIFRTQIKYVNRKKGDNLELLIERKHNNCLCYTDTEIDLILIYCPIIDEILAFYPDKFHDKKRIFINLNNPKSKKHYRHYLWN